MSENDQFTVMLKGLAALDIQVEKLQAENAQLKADLLLLERVLEQKGYHKSCRIPACNCGDVWKHGGHAEERLQEISEALPYANGVTILGRVEELTAELDDLREWKRIATVASWKKDNDRLKEECAALKLEAQAHAQEARTANSTIAEIYQIVSGATGELSNWHGAQPVKEAIAHLKAELAHDQLRMERLREALRDIVKRCVSCLGMIRS